MIHNHGELGDDVPKFQLAKFQLVGIGASSEQVAAYTQQTLLEVLSYSLLLANFMSPTS
jgi:hypothetical protein